MTAGRKSRIHALLKGIETGDEAAVAVVHPDRYIQHNPQTREGGPGLVELFKQLATTSPKVNIVRMFSDGDFVFAHAEYDFGSPMVGFEVFRFEGDYAVEHWDNIQPAQGPNASGHSMVDGPTEAGEPGNTESSRTIVEAFIHDAMIAADPARLYDVIDTMRYIEHNPAMSDDLLALQRSISGKAPEAERIDYQVLHRCLAEGDFVLTVCEGYRGGVHTAFYDLFRLANGKIAEHWDTAEAVPPRSEWLNDNGKF